MNGTSNTNDTCEDITNPASSKASQSFTSTISGLNNATNTSPGTVSTSQPPSKPASSCSSLNAPISVSAVWAYFEKDTMGNSICKFCNRVVKGHHSSNLLSHLRTAGRTDPSHQQANLICEEHRESKRHIKRQKLTVAMGHGLGNVTDAAALAGLSTNATAVNAGSSLATSLGAGHSPYAYRHAPNAMATAAFYQQATVAAAAATLTREQREALAVATQSSGAFTLLSGSVNQSFPFNPDQLSQELGTNRVVYVLMKCTPILTIFFRAANTALFLLLENFPLEFATRTGFHHFIQQLVGDKTVSIPSEDALKKSITILQESLILTTKMLIARTRAVGISVDLWQLKEVLLDSEAFLAVSVHFSVNFREFHVVVHCAPTKWLDTQRRVDSAFVDEVIGTVVDRIGLRDKVVVYIESGHLQRGNISLSQQFDSLESELSLSESPHLSVALAQIDDHGGSETLKASMFISSSKSIEPCLSKSILSESFSAELLAIEAFVHALSSNNAVDAQIRQQSPKGFDYKSILQTSESEAWSEDPWFYDYLYTLQSQVRRMEQLADTFALKRIPKYPSEWVTMYLKKMRPFQRYWEALHGDKSSFTGSDKEFFKHGISSISTIGAALVTYAEKQAIEEGRGGTSDDLHWAILFRKLESRLRFSFCRLPRICYAATMLDPRYKDREYCYVTVKIDVENGLKYLRSLSGWSKSAQTSFRNTQSEHDPTSELKNGGFDGISDPLGKSTYDIAATGVPHDDDDDLLSHLPSASSARDALSDENDFFVTWEKELGTYMNLPVAERNVDPLYWWRQNQLRFPMLAPYAEVLLSLPATATLSSCERVEIEDILLRAQSRNYDLASTELIEAYLSFQKNKAYALEWFGAANSLSFGNQHSNSNSGPTPLTHRHDNVGSNGMSSTGNAGGMLDLDGSSGSYKDIENV
ncbi:unnamed protein product [Albugo candida]|nr:unnamed protein product [Albugo candida]|eukprot:CCI39840.1 unnamed protein product [Albugo candida]